MAVATRLVSLITLSSLAVLLCSFGPAPAAALTVEVGHSSARSLHSRAHDALAQRKRSAKKSKRCRPRAAPSAAHDAPSKPAASHAPAPSAHSSSASSGHVAPTHFGGAKTGLAWPNGPQFLDKWSGVKTMYTWSPACPDNAEKLGITCCPMLWGWNQVDQFKKTVAAKTPKCVMGPNEPELASQSNMDPHSAAQLWNTYIRPLKAKGVTLISPACTSDPGGKTWMKTFFQACGGNDKCGIDYYAVHYYDVSAQGMIDFLVDLHNTFGVDMWITEFACQNFNGGAQCSEGKVWDFQSKITNFVNNTPWINKMFPWGAMRDLQGVNTLNSLMTPDGGIRPLGHAYLGI